MQKIQKGRFIFLTFIAVILTGGIMVMESAENIAKSDSYAAYSHCISGFIKGK